MLFAPSSVTDPIRLLAREFLINMRDGNFEQIWNYSITLDAIEFISTAAIPLYHQKRGDIDNFLAKPLSIKNNSIAFQHDAKFHDNDIGIRTNFFMGVSGGLEKLGWYELFLDEDSVVFFKGTAAVLVTNTMESRAALFLPFVDEGGRRYRIDFEAIAAFSMEMSAQKLHRLATRALEIGETRSALAVYELASRLSGAYDRLRQLVWDHPIVEDMIKEERKRELQAEIAYTVLAKEQVQALLATPSIVERPIDMAQFLRDTFRRYDQIIDTELDDEDLESLHNLSDEDLRIRVAQVLVGVDSIEAQREARKPHGPAEIADMEVAIARNGLLYHLLMPFKSGREVRGGSVPVDVFYQILRPHMFFEKGVVVFITAKPCSQLLMNLIKISRDRKGWPIGVIEHTDLARLLKANDFLPCIEVREA
jgi:hypothetical protein